MKEKLQQLSSVSTVRLKQYFYLFIHLMFLSGMFYAFYHFLRTPKTQMELRRLWAYESWIILSFYGLFVYLILTDREYRLATREQRLENRRKFTRILKVNLLLLLFPWGLFLLLAPANLLATLGFVSVYWRVLGGMSLAGVALYFYPFYFYRHKLSYAILVFGAFDNLVAAIIVAVLFFLRRVPIAAFSAVPLLFYFAYFFWDQSRLYRYLRRE